MRQFLWHQNSKTPSAHLSCRQWSLLILSNLVANGRLEIRQVRWWELGSNSLKQQPQFVKLSYSSRNNIIFLFGWSSLWLYALPPRREFTPHISNPSYISNPTPALEFKSYAVKNL